MRSRRGQSTAEYAIVIGVIVAAVVAMQVYVKRSFQGKLKDTTDFLTSQSAGAGDEGKSQYEPYYATSSYTVEQTRDSTEKFKEGGTVDITQIGEETKRAAAGFTATAGTTSKD